MNFIEFAAASLLSCQPTNDMGQVGLWESRTTSMGGIGNAIELNADGTYANAIVVLVDLTFDFKEGVLYFSPNEGENISYEDGISAKVTEDGYIAINHEGEKDFRKRIGGSNTTEIYGAYRYRHYTGAIAYEKFKKDGSSSLRIPMRSEKGCYRIDNEKIFFFSEGASESSTELSIGSDELVFRSENGEFVYDAVAGGPWYQINEIDYVEPK